LQVLRCGGDDDVDDRATPQWNYRSARTARVAKGVSVKVLHLSAIPHAKLCRVKPEEERIASLGK